MPISRVARGQAVHTYADVLILRSLAAFAQIIVPSSALPHLLLAAQPCTAATKLDKHQQRLRRCIRGLESAASVFSLCLLSFSRARGIVAAAGAPV